MPDILPSCYANELLLDLRRGPVLRSETAGKCKYLNDTIKYLEQHVLPDGWYISTRRIHRPGKFGLRVVDYVYTLTTER